MSKAIGYVRVSSDSQAESGAGLAAQRAAIVAYASRHSLTLAETFEDAAVSGSTDMESRPGLMAAIGRLKRGDVLIVAKRDRLGRDVLNVLMMERAVSKRGACIVSADGVGNGDGAADAFMRQVIDAAAQFERGLIRARTKAAMAAKRKAGERIGDIPFGWTLADGILVEVEAEQLVIRRIMECREAGVSLRAIAAELTASAITTKKGGSVWTHSTVQSIVNRQAALAA